MARRRYADHRRWMVRSFALTASIITNRIWGVVAAVAVMPQLDTTFHGDGKLFSWTVSAIAAWLGWTLPLLAAEWWLERHRTRGRVPVTGRDAAGSRPEPVLTGR